MTSAPESKPIRGANQIELQIHATDTGVPVDGLEVSMLPFMPAMGHGAATHPQASALGNGRYQVDNVSLPMSGLWELRTTISGAQSDYVAPRVEVE
jgi:hypothetical protein